MSDAGDDNLGEQERAAIVADSAPVATPQPEEEAACFDEGAQPQSAEAERAVLGSILLDDKTALPLVVPILTAEDFFSDKHQRIYRGMLDRFHRSAGIDILTLKEELNTGGTETVDAAYLSWLMDGIPDIGNVENYARIVKEKATARGLILACGMVIRDARAGHLENAVARAKRALDQGGTPEYRILTAAEFLAERDEALASLWGDGLLVCGGGYLIVSGPGGVGKTILLIGLYLALAAGRDEFLGFPLPGEPVPCLILEAEGSRSKFRERIASMAGAYGLDAAKLPLFFHTRDAVLSIAEALDPMLRRSGAQAALLDSVGHFHDGDENSTTEWRRGVTKPLGGISRARDAGIAFADHYVKPSETRQNRHKTKGTASKVDDCGAALRLEYGKGGKASRVLYFDRVRDGGLPEPDRIALTMDVAAGYVALDPDGCIEAVPETLADERREKARVTRSLKAQEKIEAAFAVLEAEKDFDPDEGISERRLADQAGMSRNHEPFQDALGGLGAQDAIELAPGGGWRRRVQ